jgi:prepilin-type N-terminal cleavage/methylation domain-containing protein
VGGAAGFTLVELMVAMVVLMLGVGGVLAMHITVMRAGAFSRSATEAAVLAEDKVEQLRTLDLTTLASGSETVDAQGVPADGPYTRAWTLATLASGVVTVTVRVSWLDRGAEEYAITYRTAVVP